MLNLIAKEFLVQKKTLLIGAIYTLVAVVAFSGLTTDTGISYIMGSMGIIYLFVNYSSHYDEKNNADIIFNSLPLSREDIVIAKYAAVFFFAAFALLCMAIAGFLSRAFGLHFITRGIFLGDVISVVVGAMIFSSTFYPVYFKFGLNKMRIFNIFVFMLVMFAPSYAFEFAQKYPDHWLIRNISSLMTNTPGGTIKMLVLIGACILMLLSMLISMRVYRNKDL